MNERSCRLDDIEKWFGVVLQRWCCRDGVGTKATLRCNIVHLSDFCLCGSGLAHDGL